MKKRILIIGGYGNFGSYITKNLANEPDLQLVIAGRSQEKCRALAEKLKIEYFALDIEKDFALSLKEINPDIVVHTSGPFQAQGYDVAIACIEQGCHYIDLADGRDFVTGIATLDALAKTRGVAIISGASSVPTLTSAVIDHYLQEFKTLTSIDYGITTAQRTNTGLATTKAVLSYAGKAFLTLVNGKMQPVFGWQGLVVRKYPELGWRLLGNCDVPDLTLFPVRYKDLKSIRFRAGLEIGLVHLGLLGMSWLVRLGIIKSLEPAAPFLLKASRFFDRIGSDQSAFHTEMNGLDKDGQSKTKTFYLVAKSGDGPFIPSTPAILCAKMLARGQLKQTGAFPCVGIITLPQYLDALKDLDITTHIQ